MQIDDEYDDEPVAGEESGLIGKLRNGFRRILGVRLQINFTEVSITFKFPRPRRRQQLASAEGEDAALTPGSITAHTPSHSPTSLTQPPSRSVSSSALL